MKLRIIVKYLFWVVNVLFALGSILVLLIYSYV